MSGILQPPLDYLGRKLARLCTRCGAELAEDSESLECDACREDSRRRQRETAKVRRAKRRRAGQCAGCGRRCRRYRCAKCLKPSGVNKDSPSVNTDKQWRVDPGTEWMRYRGKGRRGRLTREEQLDEYARDAGFAIGYLQRFVKELPGLKRLSDVPVIQRKAAWREVGERLGSAERIIELLRDVFG